MNPKAVVLLSGGLDSTTALYVALRDGYRVSALTLDYGQLHKKEIQCARQNAEALALTHEVVHFGMPWKGSALLDVQIPMPSQRSVDAMQAAIPATYVPARNTIFMALAASYAEATGAASIFIGANALDYSGYPDCRPDYFEAFQKTLNLGTKAGVEGQKIEIAAPLLHLSKREIVELAQSLGIPFERTWSCYQGEDLPCKVCDACQLRAKGFQEAGIEDPLIKLQGSGRV